MGKVKVIRGPMDPKTEKKLLAQEAAFAELVIRWRELTREVDAAEAKLERHYRKYPDHWDEVKALWESGMIEKPGTLT